ncbi:MAG: hypothetical protein ACK5DE_02415 [Bacteroidota bacterium]|jgi:hypothetical protein
MIRLRDKHGNEITPDTNLGFVEVCDLDGNVACAVYPDSHGFVHVITAQSKEAARYSQIFKVKFSKIVNVSPELKE